MVNSGRKGQTLEKTEEKEWSPLEETCGTIEEDCSPIKEDCSPKEENCSPIKENSSPLASSTWPKVSLFNQSNNDLYDVDRCIIYG